MTDLAINFGVNTETFGALTGWNYQDRGSTPEKEVSFSLNKDGNENASTAYGDITRVSASLKANTASAVSLPIIGAVLGGNVLESIDITTGLDYATASLSGHNHTNNAHANAGMMQAALTSFQLSSGWGAIDFGAGTAGAAATVKSSTLRISVQHADDYSGVTGNHNAGENYQCVVEATVVWSGVPSSIGFAAPWVITNAGETKESNTGHLETTCSARQALTLSLP